MLPGEVVLNSITTRIHLGFVGDIMGMGRKVLSFSSDVRLFFQECDYLIGNMEGTITHARKTRLDAQRHDLSILDTLARLFPPDRTLLSVANNHAGDFPASFFRRSVNLMRDRGFRVLGLRRESFADIENGVRIVAASMWSNRPCGEIAYLDAFDRCSGSTAFSIAYPHWGYELEMYPRPEVVRAGERLLLNHDAVLGHHPHIPQPLTAIRHGDATKLLAFSLGDFCTGLRMKKFQYGTACKIEIGPGKDGIWRIGTVRWLYTRVLPDKHDTVKVAFVPDLSL
jgi:poly-gamma-glutamate capsule biosynthesis protein CapA/YwtB (metallophosphatase superfamily)